MSDGEMWEQARQTFARVSYWCDEHRPDPLPSEDADRALEILDDIRSVRQRLDHAELSTVRVARQGGKSWAEIATMLGISRQSAWERWRELDGSDDEAPGPPSARDRLAEASERIRTAASDVAATVPRPGRRPGRRVPNVVGASWSDAVVLLRLDGLRAVGADPDVLTPEDDNDQHVVTDQSPESGARVPHGTAVRLWFERRGGSGVREPRRPKVPPLGGRQIRDEETNTAVG